MHTLRHLKPWQVTGRLVAAWKRKAGLTRIADPPSLRKGSLHPAVPFPRHDPWNVRSHLLAGRFRFLGREERLVPNAHERGSETSPERGGEGPGAALPAMSRGGGERAGGGTDGPFSSLEWSAEHVPLLWQFNLHYFNYLHLLAPAEQVALCRSWAKAHPVPRGVAWHPYPTSLRIVNWCTAGIPDPALQRCLYQQAAFLYRNVETYVYGNHVLENARALVLAGCFFEGQGEASRWLDRGMQLFREETPIQILPDGGHFERSPMYHALVLEGYLDVLNVLPCDHADRPWLVRTVQHMGDALLSWVHPDGRLALFNDSTQEVALPAATLETYLHRLTGYRPQPRHAFPETGYFVHRGRDAYLVVDGGPVGPEHLLAHAHADVFSYELSVRGRRYVVDSGVYEYEAGPMRAYVRGTAAHSTVSVDGVDQVECWSSFRVARRAAPHDVGFRRTKGRSHFEGTFGGYARLVGDAIEHRRQIVADDEAGTLSVEDVVDGQGYHRVESRIQLHPDVEVEQQRGHVVLVRDGVACRLVVREGSLQWETGWYCPRFGTRQRRPVAVVVRHAWLPVRLSYTIHYA